MSKTNPIKQVVRNLRRALNYAGLYEKDVCADPFEQFEGWMKDAVKKEAFEPNAMTLATASKDGKPTARTVLLKDYSPEGFTFYTNFSSRKGQNLIDNPQASLVFYWASLSRQVLIDGTIVKTDRQNSEDYFHSRPRGSQIAAFISEQSSVVKDRTQLEDKVKEIEEKYKDQEIPCPENWGGFLLKPIRIEFWQGRPDRLHDRICFTQDGQKWKSSRLAP